MYKNLWQQRNMLWALILNMVRLQLTRKLPVISTARHFKFLFNQKRYFCLKLLGVCEKLCFHVWVQKPVFEIMEWNTVWWWRTLAVAYTRTKLVCGRAFYCCDCQYFSTKNIPLLSSLPKPTVTFTFPLLQFIPLSQTSPSHNGLSKLQRPKKINKWNP